MSTLEQEILDRFRLLDASGKHRVIGSLEDELQAKPVSLAEWLAKATTLREKLRAKYGEGNFFGVQSMLDDIREEASWPRW